MFCLELPQARLPLSDLLGQLPLQLLLQHEFVRYLVLQTQPSAKMPRGSTSAAHPVCQAGRGGQLLEPPLEISAEEQSPTLHLGMPRACADRSRSLTDCSCWLMATVSLLFSSSSACRRLIRSPCFSTSFRRAPARSCAAERPQCFPCDGKRESVPVLAGFCALPPPCRRP
mgnify:CR=1 FL=1